MRKRRRGCMTAGQTRWAGRTTKPVHLKLGGINHPSVHIPNALSHHSLTMARSADSALEVLRLEVSGVKMETGCSRDVTSQDQPGDCRSSSLDTSLHPALDIALCWATGALPHKRDLD